MFKLLCIPRFSLSLSHILIFKIDRYNGKTAQMVVTDYLQFQKEPDLFYKPLSIIQKLQEFWGGI